MSVQDRIRQQVTDNNIILFMKGTPQFPQCGFSGKSVQLLQACGAKFASVNVLADPEIREGIKEFSNWPTIPQLYIKGQFIGGCDIITELYQKGELQKLVTGAQGSILAVPGRSRGNDVQYPGCPSWRPDFFRAKVFSSTYPRLAQLWTNS